MKFRIKKMYWIILASFMVVHFPLFAGASTSDIKEAIATGRAEIIGGDVQSAEKAALDKALRNAVEKVGVEVVSETVVENFELVKDRIVTRAKGYIHGYEILDKKKGRKLVQVKVKAKVSASKIKDDADFIYQEMDKPRVLIIVNEVRDGESSPSKIVENMISEYFLSKNFKVVDSEVVRQKIARDEIRLAAEGDINAAKKLGARAGAEVIITGTSIPGKPESVRGILYAAKSSVSLKSIRADTGELYATSTESANGIDATPSGAVEKSYRESARKAASEIFWRTVKKWNEEKVRGRSLELVITGVKFSEIGKLKKLLLSIDGITEIHQRAYEKPSVVFDVISENPAGRLAEIITAKTGRGFRFEVISVSAARIHLKRK